MRQYCIFRAPLLIKLRATAVTMILVMFGLVLGRSNSSGDVVNLTGLPAPYSFNQFCRLNSAELWAVGGQGSVQYTDMNGTSERKITDKSLNGVYFTDSFAGWVVGDDGTILRTEDRGANWEVQRSGVTVDLYGITCHDANRCWVVGRNGLILRTVDQGNHWKVLKSGTSAILFAVNFVNGQSGWAVGQDGIIVHTNNGGETWAKQRAVIILFPEGPYAAPTDLLAVRFVDDKRGWVAGAGGVARTGDGGRTWEARKIEGSSFIGLVTKNGATVYAVSREGTNYITRDGGLSWAPVSSGSLPHRVPHRLKRSHSVRLLIRLNKNA